MISLLIQVVTYTFYSVTGGVVGLVLAAFITLLSDYYYYLFAYYFVASTISIICLSVQFALTNVDQNIDKLYREARSTYFRNISPIATTPNGTSSVSTTPVPDSNTIESNPIARSTDRKIIKPKLE